MTTFIVFVGIPLPYPITAVLVCFLVIQGEARKVSKSASGYPITDEILSLSSLDSLQCV